MLVSLAFFIIGFTMGGLNYVVTVLQARTRGMTLMRLPLTVWGIFMATILGAAGVPGAVRERDHDDCSTTRWAPASSCRRSLSMGEQLGYNGGSPMLFQHLFWFFGHPESLHRRAAGLRHRLRPDQRPRAQEHLRLPDDGLGDSSRSAA